MEQPKETANTFANLPDITREPRFAVRVKESKEATTSVVVLTLERPKDFSFKAGQYVWLVLPERTKKHGLVDRRAYSISSAAEAPYLELLIRVTDSDYTHAVGKLKAGDEVHLIGPMGSEFTPPPEGAIMVSGGVGIAPFLSILRSAVAGSFTLYAFEDPRRPLHCKDELNRIAQEKGCHLAFIQEVVEKRHLENLRNEDMHAPIFISGPQGFVNAATQALIKNNIERKRMHFEAFYPSTPRSVAIMQTFRHVKSTGEIEEKMSSLTSMEMKQLSLDEEERLGSRITSWFLIATLIADISSAVELVLNQLGFPWTQVFAFIVFGILLVGRLAGVSDKRIERLIVPAIFASLIVSRIDPSSADILQPWILIFPTVAYSFLRVKEAFRWSAGFIAVFLSLTFLGNAGMFGIPDFVASFDQFALALVFLTVIIHFFSAKRATHDQTVEAYLSEQQNLISDSKELLKLSDLFVKVSSQTSNHVILTDKDGHVLYANHAAEHLTGYTFAEMRGQAPRLWGGLMSPIEYRNIWEKKSHGIKITHQIINRRRDGSLYIALGRITPIMEDSEVVAYVATEEDVTNFANLDKTKSEFVSLASHQLRTPLSAINWYSEMLLAGDAGAVNIDQRKYLEEVHEGGQRMSELINALLNVSRIDLGTFIIEPAPTDIVALLRSVMDEQKLAIDDKYLHLEVPTSWNIPTMNVDPKLIRMVFQNLLSNAIKYTPEKGTIAITMEVKKKGEQFEDETLVEDALCFSMRDSGYGIPKQQQRFVFTKLFRADNAKEKDTTGTGLGLYIIKSVLDHARGKIWFESEENKGTTFYFTLPLSGMEKREGARELG